MHAPARRRLALLVFQPPTAVPAQTMTPLHHAARGNRLVAAERLVKKGDSIDAKFKVRISPTLCQNGSHLLPANRLCTLNAPLRQPRPAFIAHDLRPQSALAHMCSLTAYGLPS
jgi:hypothetical protein